MADENTPPKGGGTSSGDEPGGQSTSSSEKDFVSISEFEKVQRANNWAQSQFKEYKSKFENLQAELDELKAGDKSDKGKPNERLAQAEARIKELETERNEFAGKLRDVTVKSEVQKLAKGKIRDDAFDAFWQLEGGKFGEVELSGEKKIGLVEAPYSSFDDYLGDLSKRHGFLLENQRARGTGEPTKGNTDGQAQMSIAQIKAMPDAERIKFLTKHPELRKRYAQGG